MGEMLQAMAVAVSALVSMAGGESKLERDAGFTCAKLCDPVTRRRGAGLGQSGDFCWWAVGPQSSAGCLEGGSWQGPGREGIYPRDSHQ